MLAVRLSGVNFEEMKGGSGVCRGSENAENAETRSVRFVAIRKDVGADFAELKFDSNRGMWRLEMRVLSGRRRKRKTCENSLLGMGAAVCFVGFRRASNRGFAIRNAEANG
jgi:hypothetical protein